MRITLNLGEIPFREEFEEAIKPYPYEIQDNVLRMTANVVQCMEVVMIVNMYQMSKDPPDWEGGEKSEEVALPR